MDNFLSINLLNLTVWLILDFFFPVNKLCRVHYLVLVVVCCCHAKP